MSFSSYLRSVSRLRLQSDPLKPASRLRRMFGSGFMCLPQLDNPRFYAMLLADSVIFISSFMAAYLMRFEFVIAPFQWERIRFVLPILIAVKLLVFWFSGLYRGMWRYASLRDCRHLAQAVLLSTALSMSVILFFRGFNGYSRSVFLLDALLTFLLAGGCRIAIRTWYATLAGKENGASSTLVKVAPCSTKPILIIGAGGSGEKILREINDNPHLHYKVVCFLDDDPTKRGRTLHGVPVLGGVELLSRILHQYGIEQVFVSVPSATGAQMRRIINICKSANVSYKTLPAIGQIMDGKVSIKALRDVNYEDLLRRAAVKLDTTGIKEYLTGRKVLVTGAGGSIGSELCRQLIRFKPEELILVDSGETNLYNIQMELRHELHFAPYHTILARVQDRDIIDDVFRTYLPDVVFHAAAYKHVPMLERNPWEAISNNVVGSRVVMECAVRYATKRFVLVSTDKAVRPTSVMGTSKRVAELVLQSMKGGPTRFMAVRFGNVLASSGSVIPLFLKQIQRGGPVTVTHAEITRYFMTIPEACQLILQTGALGRGGEIFVLEMGTPVKIADLANDLIRLSGKEPGRDIEIVYTGLRPGEKLYEELITRAEDVCETTHEKIMVLQHNGRWNWNGFKSQDRFRNWLNGEIEDLQVIAKTHDASAIKSKLREVVSEYTPQETKCVLHTHQEVAMDSAG